MAHTLSSRFFPALSCSPGPWPTGAKLLPGRERAERGLLRPSRSHLEATSDEDFRFESRGRRMGKALSIDHGVTRQVKRGPPRLPRGVVAVIPHDVAGSPDGTPVRAVPVRGPADRNGATALVYRPCYGSLNHKIPQYPYRPSLSRWRHTEPCFLEASPRAICSLISTDLPGSTHRFGLAHRA